ncbi:hypothetical protein DFP73DRAFT_522516 [Morchella snyderi]|nr:hypothetical protein DFP73DRAFT_522516 [Morchella snyderi]
MKLTKLSILACLSTLGLGAARPTAHAPANSGSVYSYWEYMTSEHSQTPITKRESRIVPVPKNGMPSFYLSLFFFRTCDWLVVFAIRHDIYAVCAYFIIAEFFSLHISSLHHVRINVPRVCAILAWLWRDIFSFLRYVVCFLDRWTANFNTPAPEPVVAPPTTSRTIVGTLTSAADALFGAFSKGKDPEPSPYAHPPTRHADSSTGRDSKYADGSTDRYSKYAASNVDDDAPPRYEDVFDTGSIVDWKSNSPEKYAPSYLSDDETVVPNGYSYFGDDKKGMSGYSSSDDDEPFNPNGGSATKYWSELLAPETVVVMPGNPLTAEGLAEEILRQANVGSATEEANYWNPEPEKRSSWQKFLDWCKHAWNTVKGAFTKKN